MSNIPKGDRKKSPMEFVDTADKIEARTLQICMKWPKRYMFFITQRTVNLASEVYELVQKANAIMPKSEAQREDRIRLLTHALGALYAYAQKIERAYSLFPLCGDKPKLSEHQIEEKSNNILDEIMDLCNHEEDAIKGNLSYTRIMRIGKDPPKSEE